ncbi:Retrotransposable element Tf2 [Senna tora]|uniref:Retrotransposable element Tf2 n=1 Tax=Senna tora TaxID=362788 RepID=A0A834XGT1_9FABA|nr:Retrotransposable element Tf2 [Senna tora]
MELPIFDGDEAISWLFRAERYFSLNRMKETEKLEVVAVCMEGRALNWLQWLETRMVVQSWSEFKRKFLRQLHQSQQGNNYKMLMALKQEGTVVEYREEFEQFSAPLKDALEEMLIGAYQNGLKEEVRTELRMIKAQSLLEPNRNAEMNRTEGKKASSSTASTRRSKVRWLTPEEVAEKRRLGECFTCDEKSSTQKEKRRKPVALYGHMVKGRGMCKEVQVEIQGTMVKKIFYLFDLGGVNMIMGIEWLESSGEVRVNWRQLTMKYREGDTLVCLKGDASLAKTEVSYRAVLKSVSRGGQGFVLELGKVEAQAEAESEKPKIFSDIQ